MDIKEALSKQVVKAEILLQNVKAIPDGYEGAWSIIYDEETVRTINGEEEVWERETRELLIILYGEQERQVMEFDRCIRDKSQYFDFRKNLQDDLIKTIAFLKSLIKAEDMKRELTFKQQKEEDIKPPMVFISHSSADKKFAEALIDLLESIGLDSKTVFCSSIDGYGIGLGNDIFETLFELFNNRTLYVIFIQSPHYYASPVSLNEMGAAWVLKSDFRSILTKDMEHSMMRGVVDGSTIYIKVNNENAYSRMNELKDQLLSLFKLPDMSQTTWERRRNKFLDTVNNL